LLLSDQVTAVFVEPVTVAVVCTVWEGINVAAVVFSATATVAARPVSGASVPKMSIVNSARPVAGLRVLIIMFFSLAKVIVRNRRIFED
jgi:hypothetical protein